MATSREIGEQTSAHAMAVMSDDWSTIEADLASPFKQHVGAILAALPMPLTSVDVKHVWQSGAEWHVEAECVGDEGVRTLLLRYLDGDRPQIVGGAVRAT